MPLPGALDNLIEHGVKDSSLSFFADSELMVKQMLGLYRVKDAGLQVVFADAKTKARSLEALQQDFYCPEWCPLTDEGGNTR